MWNFFSISSIYTLIDTPKHILNYADNIKRFLVGHTYVLFD